jgi:hypothetical protein
MERIRLDLFTLPPEPPEPVPEPVDERQFTKAPVPKGRLRHHPKASVLPLNS